MFCFDMMSECALALLKPWAWALPFSNDMAWVITLTWISSDLTNCQLQSPVFPEVFHTYSLMLSIWSSYLATIKTWQFERLSQSVIRGRNRDRETHALLHRQSAFYSRDLKLSNPSNSSCRDEEVGLWGFYVGTLSGYLCSLMQYILWKTPFIKVVSEHENAI